MKTAIACLLLVTSGTAQAGAPPPPLAATDGATAQRSWVVIVANNRSLDRNVTPLRYADDDGARWYELLAPTAARISLFTVFDAESERLFRDLAPKAESPTRAALLDRLATYNAEMAAARAKGEQPVLYLVIIGHGEIDADGEGYVSLLDGPLGRRSLFHDVIAPSKASFNHVIIDACNAWLMVSQRGGDEHGPGAAEAIKRYVADEDLERHPETGVVLATSRAQATHEWSVYGGGIFSHQLRSALAGAADVNGDGRVEYSEVRAFVAAANEKVDDPRARLDVFVRPPPLDRSRALMDLGSSHFQHFLRLPAGAEGRFWIEDARGVRYADVNKSAEHPLLLALVEEDHYFVRSDHGEVGVRLGAPGTIELKLAEMTPRTTAERGAVEDTFHQHLFEVPYDPAFYRGYVASTGDVAVVDPPPHRFDPPLALGESVDGDALAARGERAMKKARELGLKPGDDSYVDMLLEWSAARRKAGDLREADRALSALERRLADTVRAR